MKNWHLTTYTGDPIDWQVGRSAVEEIELFDTLDEAYERYRQLTEEPAAELQCVTVEHAMYSDEPLHWERPWEERALYEVQVTECGRLRTIPVKTLTEARAEAKLHMEGNFDASRVAITNTVYAWDLVPSDTEEGRYMWRAV